MKTKQAARNVRRRATDVEAVLWQALRNRQLDGRKFRRQRVIGPFVVDGYCAEERLIVEADGGVHSEPSQVAHDWDRQRVLEDLEMCFLRLSNDLILHDLPTALARIAAALGTPTAEVPPQPPPLPQRAPAGEGSIEKDQPTCH